MAKPPQEVCLLHTQTITASGTSTGVCIIPQDYWSCLLCLTVGTVTGTSPTLDVYIQQGWTALVSTDSDGLMVTSAALPSIWDDYAHFSQVTATGNQFGRILAEVGTATNALTAEFSAASDASTGVAAGKVHAGPFGMAWRVKWVAGGASPSFAGVGLIAQFLMPQG